jgi:two-component system sensor histidine kinase HupT/HoxJ
VREGGSARRIEVTTAINRPRTNVTVTIRDYGPGIAAEVMPRISTRSSRPRTSARAPASGLAITYGIVHEHGGTITAMNAKDGGAMFQIELPSAASGDKVVAESAAE